MESVEEIDNLINKQIYVYFNFSLHKGPTEFVYGKLIKISYYPHGIILLLENYDGIKYINFSNVIYICQSAKLKTLEPLGMINY